MAEGQQLPWKVQKIDTSRGPPGNYDRIRDPLPPPPVGTTWARDQETGEWSVVKCDTTGESDQHSPSSAVSDGAIEGVDYVIHTVQPSDTFSGICLRYKISALQLRRANRFSGTNLRLAPSRLVIPLGKDGLSGGHARRESPEYKLKEVMAAVPQLGSSAEAKSYLLMSGWDVEEAIKAAKDDLGWEGDMKS
mmetsp:Transcript_1053/g.1767  ORF Transcript_1053/g.1767 Transcript_1053/m.1767 type:complete len:192 (-) Transcript_1053:346-921(-)|eukprot:CAMPEP_0197465402 /NCGR_PEP_ID=MMETSP1175-20131217/64519_1 /TAXON_ID=1003142 /ORGANISM="Triceratium dubium, Strain CCMP147" /LENGTH=191 /DNA_ID=CAMNT_0043001415 /DNA_START=106 /DNA_END=681 /DNA_ORIENTATION=-